MNATINLLGSKSFGVVSCFSRSFDAWAMTSFDKGVHNALAFGKGLAA